MEPLPNWALPVLATPGGEGPLTLRDSTLLDAGGNAVAQIVDGIVRFALPKGDPSIKFYEAAGGAQFHERSRVAYAMSTLDTPIYHDYLKLIRPAGPDAVIADIGGGDGRNAVPWLEAGVPRVIVIDAIAAALDRLRRRIAETHPDWLARILFVEADLRRLPLRAECCNAVQCIEALEYLNEEFEVGLRECVRILKPSARLLISDRDYESALLVRLFYFGGVAGMLQHSGSRDLWDGTAGNLVRSRVFTAAEYRAIAEQCGLVVEGEYGISSLSLVLAYLLGQGKITAADHAHVDGVHDLLRRLGKEGAMRRSHVLIGRKPPA
jgi:SAM-dependent methyltransferase